ncbi:MAG: hypothetical protein AABZ46_00820, partial [Nitrospirota bacterium]
MEARIAINPEKTREADFLFKTLHPEDLRAEEKNVVGDKIIDLFSKGIFGSKDPEELYVVNDGKELAEFMPAAVVEGNNDSTLGWLADFVVRQEGVAVSPAIFDQPPIAAPMLPVVPPPVIPTPAMPGASSPVARIDFKARGDQRRHEEFNALPDRLAAIERMINYPNGERRSNKDYPEAAKDKELLVLVRDLRDAIRSKGNFPGLQQLLTRLNTYQTPLVTRQEAVDRIASTLDEFLHPTHNKDYRMVQAEVAVREKISQPRILAAAEKVSGYDNNDHPIETARVDLPVAELPGYGQLTEKDYGEIVHNLAQRGQPAHFSPRNGGVMTLFVQVNGSMASASSPVALPGSSPIAGFESFSSPVTPPAPLPSASSPVTLKDVLNLSNRI